MNSKHKLLAFLCLLFFVTGLAKAQLYNVNNARWNWDPRTSAVYPSGQYVMLPLNNKVPQGETQVIHSPQGILLVYPNIQVLPSTSTTETEVPLVTCRTNPNLMFGSSNAVNGSTINSGSYISTNGGASWIGGNTINNGNTNNQRGDPGPTYDKNQTVIFTHLSSASNFGGVTGMAAEYSTNFGQNFSPSVQVHNSGNDDKNLAGTDDNPGSPYYGHSYFAWVDYVAGISYFAQTTNGGVSWSSPMSINTPPAGYFSQGNDVDAMPNGTIIVCWSDHQNVSPYTEKYIGIGRSTNGGTSFTDVEPAYNCNGTRSFAFNGWSIRTNSFPRMSIDKSGGPRNGWIYIVTSESGLAPAGSDADIIMHRSTDGGLTWSAGIRVNQDPLNNGKVQFFPCVNVDAGGGVNVAYYDNRNFPSVGDSCSVFVSRSLDGGNSFVDVEIADHHFRPKPCTGLSGGYMGDYIGVTSGNGKIWAFWMDDKAGSPSFFNAWAGSMSAGAPAAHDISTGPFMNLPALFLINNTYNIQTRVQNIGTSNETGVPVKWFINGSLINTTNKNLNSFQVDSVSNSWMPTVAGNYTLMYASALANDTNRFNDTVKTTVAVLSTLPGLCEGFTNSTFPPNQWTSSGAYWLRNGSVSGFGLGIGTAYYNSWNAPASENEDLKTLSFNPTQFATDSLTFDYAYSPYPSTPPYFQDSLVVLASTNGGSSWISLVRMGPSTLQTAPASNSEFIPASNQWAIKRLALPIGTNKVDLLGESQFGNDIYIDSVCVRTLTGIIPQTSLIPKTYSLSQNFPNPFNPTTLIKYGIPKQGLVKIVVYDVLGREVSTLINEVKQAGTYEINFNASNLSSGVYFYRITAGDFTDVKKMMLIK